MPASDLRLQVLLNRYLNNQITADELKEFWQLFPQRKDDEAMRSTLLKLWEATPKEKNTIDPELLLQQIYQRAKDWEAIEEEEEVVEVRVIPMWRKWAVAASIIATIGIAVYVISTKEKSPAVVASPDQQHDIPAPDKNRAQIKLSDGTIVYLDSAANGELVNVNGVQVTKTEDGKIIYTPSVATLSGVEGPKAVDYNTLTNPRGSIVMHMTLSDGSKVWLNAGSSITYPVAFIGNERKISMTGEAYFEIAKVDLPAALAAGKKGVRMPFLVEANGTTTEVLGTHFNINAYDNEQDVKVTLLEGSVSVIARSDAGATKQSPAAVRLTPGQQAVTTHDSRLTIHDNIDLEQTMAWKNGKFQFSNTNIQDIMKQAERWYNVEVVYEGNVKNERFGGSVPRTENISQLIKALELTGTIKISISNKTITVRPAK